ncbi:MAG: hypothetical protein VKL23_00175 [Cyanobacteriota bacterium]|jgi:hypothetical protein|nr:hypothetical protein [Cyanobacteriota bacterium]
MSSSYRPPARRGSDPLEQGLDRLVSAGRQLVDGVSGARPGSRPGAPGGGRRAGALPRLDSLGRWVEDKLDWIIEDGDDWREPWQDARPRRRPLEAISRRSITAPLPERNLDREPVVEQPQGRERPPAGRPLPRSSRRRLT